MKCFSLKNTAILFILCVVCVFSCACTYEVPEPEIGMYFADIESESVLEKSYFYLSEDGNRFSFSQSVVSSYAEIGTYEIKEDKLIAETQSTTFVFEIMTSERMKLIDIGELEGLEYWDELLNCKFVFSENGFEE